MHSNWQYFIKKKKITSINISTGAEVTFNLWGEAPWGIRTAGVEAAAFGMACGHTDPWVATVLPLTGSH